LKNKGFKKDVMTKIGLYAIANSTTPKSNKSVRVVYWPNCAPGHQRQTDGQPHTDWNVH